MKAIHFWAANLVFLLHVGLGVVLLIGWLFPSWYLLYWATLAGWIGSWLLLGYCPLSKIEFSIRHSYDPAIDPNTEIIQHYIKKFTGHHVPSETIIRYGLVVCLLLFLLSVWLVLT